MREILFRGQRTYNGKWVEGYIARNAGVPLIIPDNGLVLGAFRAYEVIPETIGQFTGLTDKNGKQIFEGDVVTYGDTDNRYYGNYAVVFEQRGGSAYFGIKINDHETWQFCLEVHPKIMEVIGNIHDNPELLEHPQ